jgi:hypothetical protein
MIGAGRMQALAGLSRRFGRDETGAGTVFALFAVVLCLLFAGLSVDLGNGWRQRELLRLSADVAAHSGASILAKGGKPEAAIVAALRATELNTPEARFGRLIDDPFVAVQTWHFSPETNLLSKSGPINAISVELQRSDKVRNPVPTFLLKLGGMETLDVVARSVVALVPTEACETGAGIYAHGTLGLEGEASVDSGVCLHSQSAVNLASRTLFSAGSGLSMPDMAKCSGMCSDPVSPGLQDASASMNLIMEAPASRIDLLSKAFLEGDETVAEVAAFFEEREIDEDLSMLDEVGVDTVDLTTGSVVSLDREQFSRLRGMPGGLVYDVNCAALEPLEIGKEPADLGMVEAELDSGTIQETSSSDVDDWGDESAEGSIDDFWLHDPPVPDFVLEEEEDEIPVLRDIVIVANCALHFTELARIEGSVIFSTSKGLGEALTATDGAMSGDPLGDCDPAARSVIMAMGDMRVPASFTASNTAFMVEGNATLLGLPEGATATHRGMALHAKGSVSLLGKHRFEACAPQAMDALLTPLEVIRYVSPRDPLK